MLSSSIPYLALATAITLAPAARPWPTPRDARSPAGYVSSNPDGDDGGPLTDYDVIGSATEHTGLFALRDAESFNFLCVPPLTREQIAEIVDLELAKVGQRLRDHAIQLQASPEGRQLLADLGYDPEMGARPLKRTIQNKVEDRLSDALLSGEFKHGDRVLVDAVEGDIVLRLDEAEPEGEAKAEVSGGQA